MHVLDAPVEIDDHELGPEPPRAAGVPDDLCGPDELHRPRVGEREAVRAVRRGEDRHAQALDVHEQDPARLAAAACRPRVPQAGALKSEDRRAHARAALVDGVVGSRRARIEARPLGRVGERGRRVEDREAARSSRPERGLHVAEGEVGAPDRRPDGGEHRPEPVDAVPVRERAVPHRLVDQEVAGRDDRQVLHGGCVLGGDRTGVRRRESCERRAQEPASQSREAHAAFFQAGRHSPAIVRLRPAAEKAEAPPERGLQWLASARL